MAGYLILYSTALHTGRAARFRINSNVDPQGVSELLDSANPGQFVTIPVVLEDEIEPMDLRVQPHLYGAWAVIEQDETAPGAPPAAAARGRQSSLGALFRQAVDNSIQQANEKRELERGQDPTSGL